MARKASNKSDGGMARFVERLTPFRAGSLGEQDERSRTEMFIDPSPYFSLAGFGLHHDKGAAERSKMVAKNVRGHAHHDPSHTPEIHRSAGRPSGEHATAAHKNANGPTADRGAPPIYPSRADRSLGMTWPEGATPRGKGRR
jgi:hypothetical protein